MFRVVHLFNDEHHGISNNNIETCLFHDLRHNYMYLRYIKDNDAMYDKILH